MRIFGKVTLFAGYTQVFSGQPHQNNNINSMILKE